MLPTHFCAHFPFRLTYYVISWRCTRNGLWARLNDPSPPANAKSPFVLKDIPELFFSFACAHLTLQAPWWKQKLARSPRAAEICGFACSRCTRRYTGMFSRDVWRAPGNTGQQAFPSAVLTRIQSAREICILNSLIFPGRTGTPADRALATDQSALMDTCWLQWTWSFNGSALPLLR